MGRTLVSSTWKATLVVMTLRSWVDLARPSAWHIAATKATAASTAVHGHCAHRPCQPRPGMLRWPQQIRRVGAHEARWDDDKLCFLQFATRTESDSTISNLLNDQTMDRTDSFCSLCSHVLTFLRPHTCYIVIRCLHPAPAAASVLRGAAYTYSSP